MVKIMITDKHKLIKSYGDYIEGYGLCSDLYGKTKYGIPIDEINNYEDVLTEFIPNGVMYEVENLKIPRGAYNIYGIPKQSIDIEYQELVKKFNKQTKELGLLFEELKIILKINK